MKQTINQLKMEFLGRGLLKMKIFGNKVIIKPQILLIYYMNKILVLQLKKCLDFFIICFIIDIQDVKKKN